MLGHNWEVSVQPVIEVPTSENDIECVTLETLTYDSNWCAPGFEHYPQVPECKLYGVPDDSFRSSDNLVNTVFQSNVEMDLQPVIRVLDIEYFSQPYSCDFM